MLASALAATYDANLATSAGGADLVEDQALALGRRVRRLPARRGRVHERRHDLEPDRAARRARAGAARRAPRRASAAAAPRSTAPTRRTTRSCAPSRRAASARAPCAGSRSTARGGCGPTRSTQALAADVAEGVVARRRRRDGGHDAHRRGRPARRDRRRLRASTASGCTSTAPTGCPPPPRRPPRALSPAWTAPTRRRSTRTSGSACRRAAAPCCCARPGRLRGRVRPRGALHAPRGRHRQPRRPHARVLAPAALAAAVDGVPRPRRRAVPRRGSSGRSPTRGGSPSSSRPTPAFELLHEPMLSTVCFRHVPPGVDDVDAHNVAPRPRDAARRPDLPRPRRGRRPRLPARVLRELPHHGRPRSRSCWRWRRSWRRADQSIDG